MPCTMAVHRWLIVGSFNIRRHSTPSDIFTACSWILFKKSSLVFNDSNVSSNDKPLLKSSFIMRSARELIAQNVLRRSLLAEDMGRRKMCVGVAWHVAVGVAIFRPALNSRVIYFGGKFGELFWAKFRRAIFGEKCVVVFRAKFCKKNISEVNFIFSVQATSLSQRFSPLS